MIALIACSIIIFVLWLLLVEGLLWKGTICVFGFIGFQECLLKWIPSTAGISFSIFDMGISWAVVIPVVVIILAALSTKEV